VVLEEDPVIVLRNVAFALCVLAGAGCFVSLFLCRRSDVTLARFLAAGPLVLLRPSLYLRVDRYKLPPTLFALAMLLFPIAWFAGWSVENS
jgi:hypothetical protein